MKPVFLNREDMQYHVQRNAKDKDKVKVIDSKKERVHEIVEVNVEDELDDFEDEDCISMGMCDIEK